MFCKHFFTFCFIYLFIKQLNYDHVTPFLKRTNSSVCNCLLREGFIGFIKNASKIFLFLVYSGALVNITP